MAEVLGERIALRMDELRLSQSAVARLAGLKQPSIGRLISGETRRTSHLVEIAAALQTTPQYLAGEVDHPSKPAPANSVIGVPQIVQMGVAFPNEVALRDMLRSLLDLIPEGATKDEAAEILAQRLPIGFAAIGPVSLAPQSAGSPAADAIPPTRAKSRRGSSPTSHT